MPFTCCPVGYIYVDAGGFYDDIGFGAGGVTNPYNAPGCARLVAQANGTFIIAGPLLDPFDCPCCPNGYEYSSFKQICMSVGVPFTTTATIPCIICPPCPPVVPFVCEPCTATGTPIDFTFDFHSRQCTSCNPQDGRDASRMDCFINEQIIDPITSNFRLKNRNFI